MINISVPFRALLGAVLSVVKRVSVETSELNANMKLDTLVDYLKMTSMMIQCIKLVLLVEKKKWRAILRIPVVIVTPLARGRPSLG